ncbi:hypothetical protein [Lysobacter gummosus]
MRASPRAQAQSDSRQRPQARSARTDDGQGSSTRQGVAVGASGIA